MDDMAPADRPDELEIVSENRWYALAETEDGYGIWKAGQDRVEPPIATFDEDIDGFADADSEFKRRTRWMRVHSQLPRVLAWIVFVAAPLWAICQMVTDAWDLWGIDLSNQPLVDEISYPPVWLRFASTATYELWVGALAVLVALWFLRRATDLGHG